MVETYDTIEQGERVKKWLQENGGAMLLGLLLAFGGLFGFRQWQAWEARQAEDASVVYQQVVDALDVENLDAAVEHHETLKEEYGDSAYAALAALRMARARIQAEQPELAESLLRYAVTHGRPEPVRLVALERLARLQLALGQPDAALATLDEAQDVSGFEAIFAEVRGDALAAQGSPAAAAEAYASALEQLEAGTGNRQLLELKMQRMQAAQGS